MKTLLKIIVSLITLTSVSITAKSEVVDVYDFKMTLKVPRVYDNTQSRGYRKYKSQNIKGYLIIEYGDDHSPYVYLTQLVNKSHKINGQYITYDCQTLEDFYNRVVLVGDNKTETFKKGSVNFQVEALPSYTIGTKITEDNSLNLYFAGTSSTSTSKIKGCRVLSIINGYVTGTMGCGCSDYGHKSPTRINGPCGNSGVVTDVACVYGHWRAKFNVKLSRKCNCFITIR